MKTSYFGMIGVVALSAAAAALTFLFGAPWEVAAGLGAIVAMPVVQASYSDTMPAAICGQVADMRVADIVTKQCEGEAGIGFGLAVQRGTDAATQATLGGSLTDFLGASVRDITLVNAAGVTADEYQANQNMAVLRSGTIWVEVTGSPTADDPVHYDSTTGVFASSGGTGPVLGARWEGSKITDPNGKSICKVHFGNYNQAG